jgi:hypothetical protein
VRQPLKRRKQTRTCLPDALACQASPASVSWVEIAAIGRTSIVAHARRRRLVNARRRIVGTTRRPPSTALRGARCELRACEVRVGSCGLLRRASTLLSPIATSQRRPRGACPPVMHCASRSQLASL